MFRSLHFENFPQNLWQTHNYFLLLSTLWTSTNWSYPLACFSGNIASVWFSQLPNFHYHPNRFTFHLWGHVPKVAIKTMGFSRDFKFYIHIKYVIQIRPNGVCLLRSRQRRTSNFTFFGFNYNFIYKLNCWIFIVFCNISLVRASIVEYFDWFLPPETPVLLISCHNFLWFSSRAP